MNCSTFKKSISNEVTEDNFTSDEYNRWDNDRHNHTLALKLGFDDLNRESKTSIYLSRDLFILFIWS